MTCRSSLTVAELRDKLATLPDTAEIYIGGGTAGSAGLYVLGDDRGPDCRLVYTCGEWDDDCDANADLFV